MDAPIDALLESVEDFLKRFCDKLAHVDVPGYSPGRDEHRSSSSQQGQTIMTGNRFDRVAAGGLRNRYFVLRHGQSVANVRGLIVSSPSVGIPDYGLTSHGCEEVRRSVDTSHHEITGLCGIYASDFRRTRETAEIASELLSAPVTLTEQLRERCFGDWDGSSNTNYGLVWEQDRIDSSHRLQRVESVISVAERMTGLLHAIEQRHAGETFLLVSHGDPLQILMAAAGGLDLRWHRAIPNLRTAELRPLALGNSGLENVARFDASGK